MKTSNFVVYVTFLMSGNFVVAQTAPPAIEWQRDFGGTNVETLFRAQQASDGGYILGGQSYPGTLGNKTNAGFGLVDYWVVKTDASGNKLWDNSYGGTNYDFLQSVVPTSDGGCLLGGYSNSGLSGNKTNASFGGEDYWLVKVDADGNKQWEKSFGGTADDEFYSMQQTSDGGYILGGRSYSAVSGNKTNAPFGGGDFWVVKVDTNGVKQWDHSYGGTASDVINSLQQTSDGGYILGGTSTSGISGNKTNTFFGVIDYWLVKADTNGVKQWDHSYGGTNGDYLYSVQQTSDGGYILGGASNSGPSGNKAGTNWGLYDYWLVKVDTNGNKQWDQSYGGTSSDFLYNVRQTDDGGYLLGGDSRSGISGNKTNASFGVEDFWLVKVDADGNKQWEQSYGGTGDDYLRSLQPTGDGGYILGGYSVSGISGNKTNANYGGNDYWVVKLAGVPLSPTLTISLAGSNNVALSWPTNASGFTLQSALGLSPPAAWSNSPDAPVIVGQQYMVTNAASNSLQIYRLKKP